MRKPIAKLLSTDSAVPRMSWSPKNLYNILARSTQPQNISHINFSRTSMTMYQQRWRSKRFLRGYHGDWIPERRFKRWLLPTSLPAISSRSSIGEAARSSGLFNPQARGAAGVGVDDANRSRLPIASLFVREVERRIDVAVFRCCFARSVYEARKLVVHGNVKLNGVPLKNPNHLLNPGDLISVDPAAVPMLSKHLAALVKKIRAKDMNLNPKRRKDAAPAAAESVEEAASTETEEPPTEAKAEASDVSAAEAQGEVPAESGEGAKVEETEEGAQEKEPEVKADVKGKSTKDTSAASEPPKRSKLPPGVRPFTLPPFAAPFLFVPPYLEPSWNTCSAIYVRHPTIVPAPRAQPRRFDTFDRFSAPPPPYRTDVPTPYDPSSELFSLAWEHYVRSSPRLRGEIRRTRDEARVGRNGFATARAKDEWKRHVAVRRGHARGNSRSVIPPPPTPSRLAVRSAATQK